MPPAPLPPATDASLDDELDLLTPFDEDDENVGTGEPGEGLDQDPDDGADGALDDQEAGDLVADDEVDLVPDDRPASPDDEGGSEADDDDIDLLDAFALVAGDAEAPGVGDEDFELDQEGDSLLDDAGEEGTVGETDLLGTGGELPDLDDDDEGAEPAAAAAVDESALLAARRAPSLPPWQDATWTLHPAPGRPLPLVAVACRGGRVFAGGAGLLVLDEGALVPALIDLPLAPGAAVIAVAIEPRHPFRLALATSSGGVLLLGPGGALATLTSPQSRPTHLAWTEGLLARLSSGQLVAYSEPGARWEARKSPLLFALVGDEQGSVTLAATLGDETRLLLSRDAGASWASLPTSALDPSPAPAPRVAITEGAIAVASDVGVQIARGGGPFSSPEGCAGALALCFEGSGPDAPLLLVVQREEGAQTYLVRVLAEGQASLVAELSGPGRERDDHGEPSIDGVAWDASRSLLWIATSGGLVAAGPRRVRG